MTESIGYIPSYVLSGEIGKKIAGLKKMEKGWLYPTYLFKFLKNPAPLFLYDKFIIDKEAAENALDLSKWGIESRGIEKRTVKGEKITDKDIEVLRNLLDTKIFIKENVEEKLTFNDFEKIKEGYNQDTTSERFRDACYFLINKYGLDYARPNPISFEAMNINLTLTLLDKLSAQPIDDVLRAPIYHYKESNILSGMEISRDIYNSTSAFLYLPNETLNDVDNFLDYHRDNKISHFRKTVNEIAQKNMTETQIKMLISRENKKLDELEPNQWNLVNTIIGSIIFSLSIQTPSNISFVTATLGLVGSLTNLIQELLKYQKRRNYQWLELIRGFLETQEENSEKKSVST